MKEHETRQFQDGAKRLAIVSGAGATGISLDADVDAKNHKRRVFYAFQLSWSADQQMQVFGRVHRSHQVSAPIIRLVLLDLAGQKRQVFASQGGNMLQAEVTTLLRSIERQLAKIADAVYREQQCPSSASFQIRIEITANAILKRDGRRQSRVLRLVTMHATRALVIA